MQVPSLGHRAPNQNANYTAAGRVRTRQCCATHREKAGSRASNLLPIVQPLLRETRLVLLDDLERSRLSRYEEAPCRINLPLWKMPGHFGLRHSRVVPGPQHITLRRSRLVRRDALVGRW